MRQRWITYPYLIWMILFIVVPLVLVLFYSVTLQTEEGPRMTPAYFIRFLDPIYIDVLVRSIQLALLSTVICLFLGYPFAMILAEQEFKRNKVLILLVVIPMWMNFLLRTYAWMTLLEKNGILNTFLTSISMPNINILYTEKAVVLGMVYNFIPFMILPIYSVLTKIDQSVVEAAEDLGANSTTVFRRIIFPLSFPGVVSGIMMVFMPAVTTFVISRLLGGGQFVLIGNLIEQQFLYTGDWGFGSALSIIMMVLILISMAFMSRYEKDHGGGGLW